MNTKEFEKRSAELFIELYAPNKMYSVDGKWLEEYPYDPIDVKFVLNGRMVPYPQLQIRRITFRIGEQKSQAKLSHYLEKELKNRGVKGLRVSVYLKKGTLKTKKKLLSEIIKCIRADSALRIETNEYSVRVNKYHGLSVACSSSYFMPVDSMIVEAISEKENQYPETIKREMALLLVDMDLICDRDDIVDFFRKNRVSKHGFREIYLLYCNGEKLLKIK